MLSAGSRGMKTIRVRRPARRSTTGNVMECGRSVTASWRRRWSALEPFASGAEASWQPGALRRRELCVPDALGSSHPQRGKGERPSPKLNDQPARPAIGPSPPAHFTPRHFAEMAMLCKCPPRGHCQRSPGRDDSGSVAEQRAFVWTTASRCAAPTTTLLPGQAALDRRQQCSEPTSWSPSKHARSTYLHHAGQLS